MSFSKIIYAKCPYCKAEQPWANFAANDQFSSGEETCTCRSCGKRIRIKATKIMKFTATKIKESKNAK